MRVLGTADRVFRDRLKAEREAFGRLLGRTDMEKPVQKITLSRSRDIAFNKLVLASSSLLFR